YAACRSARDRTVLHGLSVPEKPDRATSGFVIVRVAKPGASPPAVGSPVLAGSRQAPRRLRADRAPRAARSGCLEQGPEPPRAPRRGGRPSGRATRSGRADQGLLVPRP